MIEIKVFKVKKNKNKNKTRINTRVNVKLVKCQNEDPKVINEEKYMPK